MNWITKLNEQTAYNLHNSLQTKRNFVIKYDLSLDIRMQE